jgi:hypothetical protein
MIDSPIVLPARRRAGRDERRFVLLAALAACFVTAYTTATIAGAPGSLLSTVFTMTVPLVTPLAWWAFVKAPPDLRALAAFLAGAATLWLFGSLVWYYYFVTEGNRVPAPAGPWEIAFVAAYALALAGIYAAMRRAISLRGAALDASVIVAAGIALGAAVVGRGLEHGVTASSLVTVARPLFGVAIIVLVGSAALGQWQGLPLSLVLVAVAQVFLTVGGVVYTYDAVETPQVDLRWAELGLLPGAVVSMLAAGAIILGIDRPVRLARPEEIPGHRVGATAVLYGAVFGLAVSVGVAFYGQQTGRETVLVVGLAASAWIGGAMALRASGSIRDLERAYDRLDRAHAALERAKDEVGAANDELARKNVELRSVHTAFEHLLVIADERTHGGLRALIEDAGEDLARLLSSYFRYRE